MVELKLYSYGPKTRFNNIEVGPDLFIALEGAGTFEGVWLEKHLSKLIAEGKDLNKITRKIHKESTKRGHASITTSLNIQLEVREITRALSMVLVAPPFGSYLQESQRRSKVDKNMVKIPQSLDDDLKSIFTNEAFKMVEAYNQLVSEGLAIEDARYLLPLCIKTSLFISTSLENYVAFIQLLRTEGWRNYIPLEFGEFVEKFESLVREIAPTLLEARLEFRNRKTTYPFPNPYKPSDPVVEGLVKDLGAPDEPVVLHSHIIDPVAQKIDPTKLEKELYDSLNPLASATVIEPMSLVAYHQAIRHRTVPTAVESIYSAVSRVMEKVDKFTVIPPDVKKTEKLRRFYLKTVEEALNTYRHLIAEGLDKPNSLLIIPQAVRLYVVRSYNGFNLLNPSGFIATRTCSYAQWEERAIAYKIMNDLIKKHSILQSLMGEKCRQLGFCPEKQWCPIILKYHRYNDELHKRYLEFGGPVEA